jgi:exopolysaccharide biosynthesis polyprenyl glycosylphosphotransferase
MHIAMEGSQSMQPYFESDVNTVSSQSTSIVEHEMVSVGKDFLPELAGPVDENRRLNGADELANSGEILQKSHIAGMQGSLRWKRPSPATLRLTLVISDGIVLIALLVLELILAPPLHLGLNVTGSVLGPWNANFVWLCVAFVSWSIAASITQVQHLNRAASLLKGPLYALCTLMLMLIISVLLLYLFIGGGVIFYTKPLLFFIVMAAPAFGIWRFVLAETLSSPRFRRRAVIVGVNAAGKTIGKELRSAKHPGANVLGYISESAGTQAPRDGLPILGGRSALHSLAHNNMIDMIIMALDYKANPDLFKEAFEASQLGISVVPMAVIYESTSGKIPLEHIGDQWYVAVQTERIIPPLYLCWRKAMDLTFGACGLVVLCLVLPVLTPLIYLDSPGPIFFRQERAGYRGRTFRMLKFRSMSTDAGHTRRAAWVTRGDPRVTRVGRFLRATHLDELPQALNILRGDMSLIGPRPERPEYAAELERDNSLYCYRLSVKPGITGWAQVKYGYGSGEQDELVKLQYDLFYVKHRSFLLDVLIILKTVMEVVLCHGL